MTLALRILAVIGALFGALVLLLLWFLLIWPVYLEPVVTDHNIAVAKSALRKGMTRDEVKAMIGKEIPAPSELTYSYDETVMIIQYRYKEILCDRYYKELDVTFVHDRVAGWTVADTGLRCFN
jgi:hypothetical protein